tara:strand:- start:94 stop:336 length:243 start_codon:yes stop_codon:yes gene_type:complete
MTEYRVDAYARVPYAAFIHANSLEEAWEIAEKKAEEYSEYTPSDFTMSCDDFSLKVDSVQEQKVHVIDIPKRDFIPGWDD